MKYRKKPVVVDAFRLGIDPMPDWFCDARSSNKVTTHNDLDRVYGGPDYAKINTLDGVIVANFSDWIIRGVAGELYPCKDSIFQATYDLAEDQ